MEKEPKSPRERAGDLISLLVLDWRPTPRQVLWAIRIILVLGVLVAIGYAYDITLWDWLKLLIVPVVLAIGGYLFTRSENRATQAAAERRTQDEALQAYLDQMSDMLIPNNDQPSLYKARPGDSLSSVARARTLTVLPRLDGERKARVVQFLYESGLISKGRPVLNLEGADLRGADLTGADLRGAFLGEADLTGANLYGVYLNGAYLIRADLHQADLTQAHLVRADLTAAYLYGAYLIGADLYGANLHRADLQGGHLFGADLTGARLSMTHLSEADLTGADLSAINVDSEEMMEQLLEHLEHDATSLKGATMPNGQKYEDWLKSEGRGEEGENTGPS